MTVNKSIIEEAALSTGASLWVQKSTGPTSDRVTLSLDTDSTGYSVSMTVKDLEKVQAAISKVLKEIET